MVIGLLAIGAIPTVTGVSLGVSEQRKANQRVDDERRMAKFHIEAYIRRSRAAIMEDQGIENDEEEDEVEDQADAEEELDGKWVVLRNDKVYLETPTPNNTRTPPSKSHTAEAFYIDYPEPEHTKHLKRGLGLVTTISSDPPMLNWIYADTNTHELKYGNRTQSVDHVVGPWDWRDDETVVTLEKKSKFLAVEGQDGWEVYFDRNGDGLRGRIDGDAMVVDIGFRRRIIENNDQDKKGDGDGNG